MKIAIVGAGAIGGYLGVKLALSGVDVTLIARGANLDAIRAKGMTLETADGERLRVGPDHPHMRAAAIAEAGRHDYVILTMKSHQVEPVAAEIDALCHAGTAIVTMQNGMPWWYFHQAGGALEGTRLQSLDPVGALWRGLKPERVIGSVVYPAAELVAPGVVRHIEGKRFTLGEPSGEKSARVLALAQVLIAAGFTCPVSTDIRSEIWLKLWGNVVFNPVSALTHATLEDICSDPLTRQLAARMMEEARAIGEKIGVQFKISIEKRIDGAGAVGAHKTSMLQDVEHGRQLELDALVASVIELGKMTQSPTPTIETVYALVRLLAAGLRRRHGHLKIE
ncbi:MAG TPA: oxidoreductase [Janthinobacterium sp.]|nr:oxidoreductase [Janthinobacterium sp.]